MSGLLRRYTGTIVGATTVVILAAVGIGGAHNRPDAGHVKFAHEAEKATNVTGFTPLPLKKLSSSASGTDQNVARADADKVPLYSKGPFTIYGKCFTDTTEPGDPWVFGEIFIKTSVGGAVFSSGNDDDSVNGFLKPSTVETERQLLSVASKAGSGNPGTVNVTDAERGAIYAAVNQLHLTGTLFGATKAGSPTGGNGLFGSGNERCIFGGTVTSG